MFSRSVFSLLDQWAERSDRKPLVLRGARQVGKTTAINLWAERFDQNIYLNLDQPEDRRLFEQELGFDDLLASLFFYKDAIRDKGQTLLFIDEIQNVPQAIASLRYFYEKANDLYVIAAGSLLETLINRHISFPVGRVEYLVMRPLSFFEFLEAGGEQQDLEILNRIPIPEFAHDRLMKRFHRYALIGGMPEVARAYLETNDLSRLKSIFDGLIVAYMDDVEKYASNRSQANVINHIIKNAFIEAGCRITFQGFGKSNYRSREMSEAFTILEKAMLLSLIYPTTGTQIPAMPDRKKSPKLQLLDTGMVNFFAGLQKELLGTPDIDHVFKGRIAEHIVGQEILALNHSALHGLQFWVREKKQSNAEMDFVIAHENRLIPIEVKSGSVGRLRSLHQYMDQATHAYAVRIYGDKLKVSAVKTINGKPFYLLSLPYYLTGRLYAYLDWFLKEAKDLKS